MKTAVPSGPAREPDHRKTRAATAAVAAGPDERRIARLAVIGFAAYCLVVLVLKWLGFSAAVYDHAKEIYHAQELRWIYDGANPPLYTWLLFGFQQVLGVRLATVLFLNTLLLFFIFLASFVLARRVLGSAFQAALAAWSLMLVGQYHKFLYTMSHSLVVAIFCPLLLWLLLRIAAERRTADYLAAGVVVGVGLLSKFLFLAALVAAVLAALGVRAMRPGMLNPKFALTLGVAAAIFGPVAVAGQDEWSRLTAIFRERTGTDRVAGYLSGLGDGIWSLTWSIGEFGIALALVSVLAIAWATKARRHPAGGAASPGARADQARFLGYTVLAGLGLLLAAVLVAGVTVVKPRFVHMFLYPLPILAVAYAARAGQGARALRRYALLLAIAGVGILAVRASNSSPVCVLRCEDLVSFDRLADTLRAAGFRRGTILANGVRLGGNMVLQFPGSRVDVATLSFAPATPPAARRGQCLIVWKADEAAADGLPGPLIRAAGISRRHARAAMRSITIDWLWYGIAVVDPQNGWRPRRTTWRYILLPGGTGTCR